MDRHEQPFAAKSGWKVRQENESEPEAELMPLMEMLTANSEAAAHFLLISLSAELVSPTPGCQSRMHVRVCNCSVCG